MKLYKFYKIPPKESLKNIQDLEIGDKYPLYAITNSKDLRNKFRATRNMKQFLEMKTEVTPEEWADFANINRGIVLDEYEYHYLNITEEDKRINRQLDECLGSVFIVSTYYEREYIDDIPDGMINSAKGGNYNFCPYIFKDKYVNALEILQFISNWIVYGHPHKHQALIEMMGFDFDGFDDRIDMNMTNQLNLFIYEYEDMLDL